MLSKLFDFLEQFMISAYLITLTQLEKSGPIAKFYTAENLKN